MKTVVKIIAIALLFVNGSGAFYGGILLITDPTGSALQLPLSFLEKSPFHSYLIPGIILIIVNGVFSFLTVGTILMKKSNFHLFIVLQGVLLGGWISIQVILLRMFYAPLHATFLVIGLCLIGCGLYFRKHK